MIREDDANPTRSDIDTSFFVLTVDLWSADGKREVNLVRHSATSPSISAATSSSYPPPQTGPVPLPYPSVYHPGPPQMAMAAGYPHHPMMMHQPMHNPNAYQQPSYPGYPPQPYPPHSYPTQSYPQVATHLPPPPLSSHASNYYPTPTSAPVTPTHFYPPTMQQNPGPLLSPRDFPAPIIDPRSSPTGMFTRNLIGSLCVSAFKLTCPENTMGVWFILQDLSVRTEGNFRSVFLVSRDPATSRPDPFSRFPFSHPVLLFWFLSMVSVDVPGWLTSDINQTGSR